MRLSMPSLYGVILAGGTGTRLWPLSRSLLPKPLLPLTEEKTLLQLTALRLLKTISPDHIVTVTQADHHFEVQRQLEAVHPDLTKMILAEPEGRNTLPAISWSVAVIARQDPKAIIGIFPSDHFISNEEAFMKALQKGIRLVGEEAIVTFGIRPLYPATGYGYIRAEHPLNTPGGFKIGSFVEKPDYETALRYLAEGSYFWNSGMFLFRAEVFQTLLKRLRPEIYSIAKELGDPSLTAATLERGYASLPKLSIDYGLMEKTDGGVVIPMEAGWNDLGSWEAYYNISPKDSDQNVIRGETLTRDTRSSLLYADQGLIATIGIENLVIIRTDDTVLVSPRERVQEVKEIVDRLKKTKNELTVSHRTVRRPWGSFTILEDTPDHKVKRLLVDPGKKLSLQKHRHRSEHWVILKGIARVICGDHESILSPGESINIPCEAPHRLGNDGKETLEVIEVQRGAYFGEDDIIRLEDDYGRSVSK
ncbi:MAG: mannose-1-phosphate guanylyltransferase/mannose-6-phosphate isomerase [Deltaproteobacteria bacterium]|nr:mannose-1-phosphate guanylyltransferase/mannose-6-phosphate isomerase [Deltaproteobacteria bacterium]